MELKHYVVLVSIVVLPKLLFCLITPIRTGIFKVVHKHPKIKSCAQKILQKDEYTGGRVHELTGDCEGLNRSGSNNKRYDKGYAYIEQLSFKQLSFSPPAAKWFPFDILEFMSVMMRGKVLSFVTTIEIGETIRIAFADNISMDGLDLDYSSSFLTTMSVVHTKRDEGQGMVAHNVCVIKNVVSEEKTRFSYKFQTNDRMELIIDNTNIICSLRIIDGNLGNIKQVAVSTPVHSFSYG